MELTRVPGVFEYRGPTRLKSHLGPPVWSFPRNRIVAAVSKCVDKFYTGHNAVVSSAVRCKAETSSRVTLRILVQACVFAFLFLFQTVPKSCPIGLASKTLLLLGMAHMCAIYGNHCMTVCMQHTACRSRGKSVQNKSDSPV